MSRLQISCTGDRVTKLRGRSRAGNLVLFTFLVIIVHVAYFLYPAYVPVPLDHFLIATMPLIGMDVVLLFYFIYMVAFTRATIRREYGISESRCRGCEDSCMAVFCTCCTIGQMGRHTADYETYRSYCCTDTGLARHIEVMV
jgi:Cys-rich protein (TIGR01571 family)